MEIKKGIDYIELIKKIRECEGEVFYETRTDKINMKSALSVYLFISIINNPEMKKGAQLVCTKDSDYTLLSDYLR